MSQVTGLNSPAEAGAPLGTPASFEIELPVNRIRYKYHTDRGEGNEDKDTTDMRRS